LPSIDPAHSTKAIVTADDLRRGSGSSTKSSVSPMWGKMLGISAAASIYPTKTKVSGGETGIQPKHHIHINYM
jgi:hypothetical protein